MKEENLCLLCGKPVGNNVFTVCDDCWDEEGEEDLLDDDIDRIGAEAWTEMGEAPLTCQYGPFMKGWRIGAENLIRYIKQK